MDFEGFIAQDFEQETVLADESTQVNIFYDRQIITYSFDSNGGTAVYQISGKFGAPVDKISNPTKEGYDFARWEPQLPETFSGEDRTFVARWVLEGTILCTPETVADVILTLQGEGPHNLMVEGEISFQTVDDIGKAMRNNSTTSINLDLSLSTGLNNFPAHYLSDVNLISIIIPDCTTYIEGRFQGNKNLQSITIPKNVYGFDSFIFCGCTELTNIIVDSNNKNYSVSDDGKILLNKDKTSIHSYPSATGEITIPNYITSISIGAFSSCENLTSVIIPDSVTSIGYEAFYNCNNLVNVQLPNSITAIEQYTFYSCYNLVNITIPNSVTSIGYSAFSNCYNLTEINIPSSITSIENNTFSWCEKLANVIIPDSITSIGSSAFSYCYGLTEINIPDSVTSIGDSAFYNCHNLESLYLSNNVTYIGANAFDNCRITNIILPDTVTSIGYGAFEYCSNLESVTIPASVTSIDYSAFQGCTNLSEFNVDPNNQYYTASDDKRILFTKDKTTLLSYPTASGDIIIPSSVTTIGSGAFANCNNLNSIEIPSGVTSIGNNTFSWCSSLTNIEIPNSVASIGSYAFYYCYSLTNITIPYGVTSIEPYTFAGCYNLSSINIPDSVVAITDGAFSDCQSLTTIILPSNLERIGYDAFAYCNLLEKMNIPSSVTSIGASAFRHCSNMSFFVDSNNEFYSTSEDGTMLMNKDKTILIAYPSASGEVKIPNFITTIGSYAFYDCANITSVILSDSVTTIEYNAFSYCYNLTDITIPESINYIGTWCFYGCDNLQTITFEDTETWYYTYNYEPIYGTEIDLTDAIQNANYLKNIYYGYNFYKE